MTLDLSLFSTMASASASFVAIIGGLIASKLITINGERESVETHILELDELIEMKSKEEASIGQELDEDDALDYITDHIDDIVKKTSLADVYEADKPQRLEFNTLEAYWNMAIGLYEKFQKANTNGCEVTMMISQQNLLQNLPKMISCIACAKSLPNLKVVQLGF